MQRALVCSFACSLAVASLSCGRVHVLEDGTYAFSVTRVLRDECDLEHQTVLGPGTLATAGHSVSLSFTTPEARLAGTYRTSVEEMTLDGTIANYATAVHGQACLLDFVTLHLDTSTLDARRFEGTMSIRYDTAQLDACVCAFWFDFVAIRVEG